MTDWTAEIDTAAQRIAGHAAVTPVLSTTAFDLGVPVEMKLEQMQHTGSFKARGAFNTLIPIMFALESPAFNGDTFRQKMPIPFGEKFHFHACTVAAAEKRPEEGTSAAVFSSSRFAAVDNVGVGPGGGRGMSKHDDGALGAVQLTAEEERKAAEEASL